MLDGYGDPSFQKKVFDKSSLSFIGCTLPANDQSISTLLESTWDYFPLEYEDLNEFVQKFSDSAADSQIVIGTAKKDNAEAGYGILIKRDPLKAIGLQFCVSASQHVVTEKGVEDLQTLHEALPTTQNEQKSPAAELWFVQPEECLETSFGYVSMQVLKFKSATTITGSQGVLKSSNDPSYWSEKARKVRQYCSIPIWYTINCKGSEHRATKAKQVQEKLRDAVEEAKRVQVAESCDEYEFLPGEPQLRTVRSTIRVAKKLTEQYSSLFKTLLDDLAADGIVESTKRCRK